VADIEITPTSLVVHIRGADQFFALESRLEVALAHISNVEASPPEAHGAWHGLRIGGTNLPGVITAGRFVAHGEWAFWDVHDPSQAIAIRLHDERYAKLIIGVDDPAGAVAAIRSAVASGAAGSPSSQDAT
jgi:hypothetical protein